MEPRSRTERRNLNDDRRLIASSTDRDQQRHRRGEKDPSSHDKRGDDRRVIWENDLYERQSL